jgi:hypothetical protein
MDQNLLVPNPSVRRVPTKPNPNRSAAVAKKRLKTHCQQALIWQCVYVYSARVAQTAVNLPREMNFLYLNFLIIQGYSQNTFIFFATKLMMQLGHVVFHRM